ncbi:MAG: VIT domain-containing protein [Gemmatimonadota bacterium]
MRAHVLGSVVASVVVLVAAAGPLSAQGWIEPTPGMRADFGVVKLRSSVTATVSGRVAQVEIEEWFENRGGALGEGDYLYPLPDEAVFSNFSLFQGDEELRGETLNAAQARSIYEEIVRRKKDPALIELVGNGLVRARVFPIQPGQTRKITLRFSQVLPRAGDALTYRYRAGGTSRGARPEPGRRGPSRAAPLQVPVALTLIAENGGRFRDAFSPTHTVATERDGPRMIVRPEGEIEGDFTVYLPLAEAAVGLTLATHRTSSEDGFFMLTLSPGDARSAAVPKDVTAVVDVSGSMSGSKLEEARGALRQLLGSLGENDRFRLVAFSGNVSTFRGGWSDSEDLEDARRWVRRLEANGGTNIEAALREALSVRTGRGRLPVVLFLTDGLPSVGEQDPERLADQAESARGEARVFAFGVGYDVNTYLLDRLSAAGRGTTEYVEPGQDIEEGFGSLARKIAHPVLMDLEIADAPVRFVDVYPETMPDLFAGEDLVVFGRYEADDDESGRLEISGRRGGRRESFGVRAAFPDHEDQNGYIPRLWASRKVGALTRRIKLEGPSEELIQEVRSVAMRYGLITEYTSYLVQEPEMVAGGNRPDIRDRRAPSNETQVMAATGQAAVSASKAARARSDLVSSDELRRMEESRFSTLRAPAAALSEGLPGVRLVGGRWFRHLDGVWTDMTTAPTRVIRIAAFSEAYFDLVARLPELKRYLAAFDRVLVVGARVSVEIDSEGSERMSEQDLEALARNFQG